MRLRGAPMARVMSCVFIVGLSPYYSRSASHRLTHGSMWSVRSTVSPPEGLFRLGEDIIISFPFFLSALRLFRTREHCPGPDQHRIEARAVCHETQWTNSSPAAVSLTAVACPG